MMEGGVPLVREIRDRVSESSLRGSIGMCLCSLGRFDEAAECFRGVVADLQGHSEQHRYNYIVGLVRALVCRGRLEEAWRVAEPCLGRFASEAVNTRASFAGVLALLEAWRGDVSAALRAADEAMALCPRVTDVPSICGFILEGVAEAYFVAWRDALASGGREAARIGKRARKTARALESWAVLYTVGKPVAALYRGRALALQGKTEKARRRLREAVRSAGALSMRWHEAAAHLELGALEPAGTPARRGHLDLAHALFGDTRAAVQLAAAEAALGRETR
jgi:tetratricopeptide (TPR) repeat protein